ncbi:hypothetical protein CPB83DRAFT_861148 [Crepidotus variabilis]|uniref:DRBM domain-containing protein n=1 Tax=Crepidotus variabilis TaxID=179855 RepID=A0A9P6JL64_9AGAR|nr:hypothetical protein CPB83DRAFT_861148 [Crepidotus variabilis]
METHPRHNLAIACNLLFGGTHVIGWEEGDTTGPLHETLHEWIVKLNGIERGRGKGTSIKIAKNRAAALALESLKNEYPDAVI